MRRSFSYTPFQNWESLVSLVVSEEAEVWIRNLTVLSLLLASQLLLMSLTHNGFFHFLKSVNNRFFSGIQSSLDTSADVLSLLRNSFSGDDNFGCLSDNWEILSVHFMWVLHIWIVELSVATKKLHIFLLLLLKLLLTSTESLLLR